jgi:hypothetical protein
MHERFFFSLMHLYPILIPILISQSISTHRRETMQQQMLNKKRNFGFISIVRGFYTDKTLVFTKIKLNNFDKEKRIEWSAYNYLHENLFKIFRCD